ncbi:hypothetical protein BKA65DRAFT_15536 [Rhexocercosporidium sp. MPI-PUGE-AT-0058]|nr:hypothetical protein BKA65DRAFT_15536 [Rhexocercosporidium sp. MPI-PUGE-AT-0058]
MEKEPEKEKVRVKRTRRSAPRAKTGCVTCKFRKVKCDERKPFCARCEGFGVKCDGYAATKPPRQKCGEDRRAVVAKPLAPKSVSGAVVTSYDPVPAAQSRWRHIAAATRNPSIPMELVTLQFDDETESRYFNLFQEKTAMQIAPYFDSDTWRRLVLQACHVPSIRHTVIAIAALHQTSMTLDNFRKMSLDLGDSVTNLGVHHQVAIEQYTKAIRGMRQALSSGRQDLRTTLITCLVIGCFEAFHGNIPLAHGQIRTGIEMLHEWKKAYGDDYILSYASPNKHVVEDDLVTTFGRLEISTGYAYTDEDDAHQIRRKQLSMVLRGMPSVFDSLTHARVYLELIFRQMEHYLYVAATWPDTYHKHTEIEHRIATRLAKEKNTTPQNAYQSTRPTVEEPQSEAIERIGAYPPEILSWNHHAKARGWETGPPKPGDEPTSSNTAEFGAEFGFVRDLIAESGEAAESRETHMAELLQWHYSFENTMSRHNMAETVGSMMLRMHFKICYVCIKTYLDDVMLPDLYTAELKEIVALSTKLLAAFRHGESTNFTLDFGLNIPLYIAGFKCRVTSVRTEIVNLLLGQPRREGFWDSQLAGKVVRWIQELEEEYAGGDVIPEWCRIRPSEVGFNMKNNDGEKATENEFGRGAELVCHQRISPDNLETRERCITLVW